MKKLTRSEFLQVSIMLFGLFFGAGNLIFPPLLGNQAGSANLISVLGFSVTAVIFPVVGAIVVGKTDGLLNLSKRVGPTFAIVFTTAIYMSIGPGLGIPRAGSVPFEMAVMPYLPQGFSVLLARLVYTFIFFSLALWISLKPNKLVRRVGKYLTPALLLLIAVMFVKVVSLAKHVALPTGDYASTPFLKGFLSGYDTMDAVAALNFGYVIALAIRRFGVEDKKQVTNYTMKAGLLAGLVLFLVYAMLSSIGMLTSGMFVGAENGAEILSSYVRMAFGDFGLFLLAAIFTLACLTTCVGLITSGGEYFFNLFKQKFSYRFWVITWTFFSFVMANFGLNNLLAFSVPLLTLIYPVALVLIVMGATHDFVNYTRASYFVAAFVSVFLPLVQMLDQTLNFTLPYLTELQRSLPLSAQGLSWVLPTLVGLVLAEVLVKGFYLVKSPVRA